MRICIDSCVFIRGLQTNDPEMQQLFTLIGPSLQLVIPRLVAQEVSRNLRSPEQVRRFYRLFYETSYAAILDEPLPVEMVNRYAQMGLPQKADAFIGAFAEWLDVRYLISDNRHFLRDLRTDAFTILSPAEFIARWQADLI
jgi:hypothetical protein